MPNREDPNNGTASPHAPGGNGLPLRSEFADDADMREILVMFVDEMPKRVDALREAWSQGEVEALRRLSHQLKGSSGGYGYPDVGAAAGKLEASLRSTPGDGGAGRLEGLRGEFDALIDLCRRVSM